MNQSEYFERVNKYSFILLTRFQLITMFDKGRRSTYTESALKSTDSAQESNLTLILVPICQKLVRWYEP